MKNILIAIACRIATVFASAAENPTIRGELKQWHKVTLTLDGPSGRETDIDPNPFTDYRLTVTFKRESGAPEYRVPGYFAVSGTMNMGWKHRQLCCVAGFSLSAQMDGRSEGVLLCRSGPEYLRSGDVAVGASGEKY